MLGIRFTISQETPFSLEELLVVTVPSGMYRVLLNGRMLRYQFHLLRDLDNGIRCINKALLCAFYSHDYLKITISLKARHGNMKVEEVLCKMYLELLYKFKNIISFVF